MMEAEPGPTPYNAPQQNRSRRSLERLLDAAEAQITAGGIEALTISDVVSRAKLSVGAFYARFPDKTALLHAVQDRFHNKLEPQIHAEMRERGATAGNLAEAVDVLTDTLFCHLTGRHELFRAFMMSSVFDPVMRARGEQVNKERRAVFSSVLLAHSAEIRHPDPALAVDLAYGMFGAVVRGNLVFGREHEFLYDVSNQTLLQELKRALTLYLCCEATTA